MAYGTKPINLTPGMDFPQWDADRRGFRTTVEHTTGGVGAMFGDCAGPEVGGNYQHDGMAEERSPVTYPSGNPMQGVVNAPGGGKGTGVSVFSASSPQIYTRGK